MHEKIAPKPVYKTRSYQNYENSKQSKILENKQTMEIQKSNFIETTTFPIVALVSCLSFQPPPASTFRKNESSWWSSLVL